MARAAAFTLSQVEPDIAVLTLDVPDKSANVLSESVLQELAAHLDQLEARRDLAGLIIQSGKPGTFIAGADLREFASSLDVPAETVREMCRRGQELFARLSRCDFVTVAAMDGVCLGGGAELAIWCDRRVMSSGEKTELGFPEVKLGLFPGWGGTARASRMIGLGNAVDLVTGGESIDPATAVAMGLVSDVVPAERLLEAAVSLIRAERASGEYLADRQRWSGPVAISQTELGFLGATASAYIQQQTRGQYPAPLAALEVLLGGAGVDVQQACAMEVEGLAQLFGTPTNAALLNVFFLTDRSKKDRGIDRADVQPRDIATVAVIGAGIMGSGIAAVTLKRQIPVSFTDASADALARGARGVLEEAAYNRKTNGPDVQRALQLAPLLRTTTSDDELGACDLVIEAVVENADVKRLIYSRLEPKLGPTTILASNTSTIPITELARGRQRPDQFCGMHFFNPVRRMKLVEVIRGKQTSDETVATVVAHAKRLGKFPIVVHDGPGFLVNRMLFPYLNEALDLLADGVPVAQIERAAKEFGMPMGPLVLYDVVGLDTAVYAGRLMWETFPERVVPSPILPALVKAGRLGQKSGRGFFSYENKKKRPEPDPGLARFVDPYQRTAKSLTQDEIAMRLFLPMLLEATRVLAEGIVRDPRDVDLGVIFGLGFPPFRGGLLYWADTLGPRQVLEMLKPLADLGPRMQPTPLLEEMARSNSRFYGDQFRGPTPTGRRQP